jgi:hypothetical protein
MAVNLSPVGGVAVQFFTNSGAVLTGGKIFTYAAGTTTPQATFTSASGSVPHSNPIILDASGRVPSGEIWLTDGFVYKFLLKDANDVLIGTYDNIIGINSNFVNFTNDQEIQTATAGQTVFTLTTTNYQPGTNSLSVFVDGVNQYGPSASYAYVETNSTTVTFNSGLHVGAEVKFTTSQLNSTAGNDAFLVSYVPPFVGSVGTNVGDKLAQTVSVKDFGAVGDGVADDTAAIQAAINSVKETGNLSRAGAPNLLFPFGTYICGSSLNIDSGNIRLLGENSTIQYTGAGNAVFIGQASYLTDLTAGYFYAGFSNIAIRCTNSAAKCVVNSGYRKIEFTNAYLVGGAIGLETEGCFATGLFYNSVCQNQSSHGINLKQRNNLFTIQNSAVLGAGGNGIFMNTSGAELKGIKLLNFDFEGCAGAINITGNTGNVLIDGCWFENNTVYNIRVSNEIGDSNKFAITIRNSQITQSGINVLIGTTTGGTLIEGVTISDCEFTDSNLIVIGGGKVNKFTETNNRYSGTSTKTLPTSGLLTVSGGNQPLFETAPTEPFGYTATGQQGEIRYSATTGRVWIKTNSALASGGWMLLQSQQVTDFSNSIATLPTGATPSVSFKKTCRTNNSGATNVTDLLNGFVSQELIIIGLDGGNTTIVHGTNIRLAGGANFTIGDNDTIHLVCFDGTKWVEVCRSNNT